MMANGNSDLQNARKLVDELKEMGEKDRELRKQMNETESRLVRKIASNAAKLSQDDRINFLAEIHSKVPEFEDATRTSQLER
ncbi:MAG: hypothetical protein NTY68_03110 [Candidatus Micrarchaeota archaeon]|nr:hypothetical protein [Candidatus Micrarchaeota archaeon]